MTYVGGIITWIITPEIELHTLHNVITGTFREIWLAPPLTVYENNSMARPRAVGKCQFMCFKCATELWDVKETVRSSNTAVDIYQDVVDNQKRKVSMLLDPGLFSCIKWKWQHFFQKVWIVSLQLIWKCVSWTRPKLFRRMWEIKDHSGAGWTDHRSWTSRVGRKVPR